MKRPDMEPTVLELDPGYVNHLLGLQIGLGEVKNLLEKMRYGVEEGEGKLFVSVPAYRTDVLHPIDLVEDVAIAYGYLNFTPEVPRLYGLGKASPLEVSCELVRDFMIGLQFREVVTLVLSNRRDQFERMMVEEDEVVETLKPVSVEQSIARTWLMPSLMGVLEKNRNREYPQRIFEVGDAITGDGSTVRKVAGVIAHSSTNYSEIKSVSSGLLSNLGLDMEEEPHEHTSFIGGRCSRNRYGFYGEVIPSVLSNFGVEMPVTAFEFNLR